MELAHGIEITFNQDAIPEQLKKIPNWVCYGSDKKSINPNTGYGAMANNPSTWSDFSKAVTYALHNNLGIGFQFGTGGNLSGVYGVDIDHCYSADTGFTELATDVIEMFPNTYIEKSPSGTGIHILGSGSLSDDARHKIASLGLEVYDRDRYFTITGNLLENTVCNIRECQTELDLFYEKYFKREESIPIRKILPQSNTLNISDVELITKISESTQGVIFRSLWNGGTSGHKNDDSSADMALCNILAYWTCKDAGRMDALFRQSGLYRPKWDKKHGAATYGEMTINKAIKDCQNTYDAMYNVNNDFNTDHKNKSTAINGVFTPENWKDPMPIKKTALLPVEKLPDEIIPAQLRLWLKDISYRMQCPLDFVAVGALVNLSSLIGTSCGVRPKKHDDWTIIPNLWGGAVGRPSTKKTPSLSEVSKPLVKLGEVAKEEFKNNEKVSMADKEVNKARKSALISEMTEVAKGKKTAKRDMDTIKFELAGMEDQEEPVLKRYKTNDSTVEKLGELLQENPRGLLVFRDELMGLLSTLNREDRQGDRAFYLEAWNGTGSHETDRIGRGFIDIPSCCISVLGGIQPSKLLAYLIQSTSTLKNDGMIQRFQLLVYPDEATDWQFTDSYADSDAKVKAYEIFEKIDGIDYSLIGASNQDDKYFFKFSDKGYEVFKEWQLSERAKVTNENENLLIIEHLDKYASLMPSLALIFHLISVVTGEVVGEDTKTISEHCAIMACGWCEYLESHARRIYGMLSGVGDQRVIELSKRIIKGDLIDGFTVRDIYRKEWHLLDSKEGAEDACNELEKLGWIRKELEPVPSRHPKTTYIINPKINKS